MTVDELLTMVNIALGLLPPERCAAADTDFSRTLTVDELVTGVGRALEGCDG